MNVCNPYLSHVVVIGSTHLVIYQSWLHGCQPQMVVRTPPVAQVIIHAASAFAQLLVLFRQTCDISVVVVTPHQRNILRHFQPSLINLQHLLVGHEHLCLLRRIADVLPNQFLLVVNHLLQGIKLLLHGLHALHRAVVYAAHANGEHVVLRLAHLLQAFRPVVLHASLVGDVIECTSLLLVPLAHVVAQKRFAMGCAYHHSATVGHCLCPLHLEECCRSLVHARPDGVGAQSHQQLEYSLVSVLAYIPRFGRVVIEIAPRTRRPVFVVQENASIFHRCTLQRLVVAVYGQSVLSLRHEVAPPYPRTYPCQS